MKIVVGFSKPKKFKLFSFLIRLWQGWSKYSHVYIRFKWLSLNEEVITEASYGRLHIIDHDNWLKLNEVTDEFEFEITTNESFKLMRYAIHHNFKEYGVLAIIGIMLKKWFPKIRIGDDNEDRFICSEWVARCFKEIDEPLIHGVNLDYITPKELYLALKEKKNA